MVAIAVMLVAHTGADPDLWGHLRFGADMIASRSLAVHDPYSFTSDIPWTNHEWLAELIFAAIYSPLGAVGLNLFKAAIVGAIAWLVWLRARRAEATPFAAIVISTLLVVVTSTRTEPIRPQLFSILFFTILLALIDRVDRGHRRAAYAIPFLFCAWANLHGGWIVGAGVVALWAIWTRRFWLVPAVAAATLVNPYGVGLWTFVHDTVGLARPEIADWVPLFKLPPAVVVAECLVPAAAIAAVAWTRRVPPLRNLAILSILAVGAVRVNRIDAFLQIAIAMLCAPAIAESVNRIDARLRRSGGLTRESFAAAVTVATMIVGAAGFTVFYISRITVGGDWVPDRQAMRFLEDHLADTHLVTWFDWGECAIWHLSRSGIQVSMDGRRETVYSERVLREHFAFYRNAESDSWRYPDQIGAEYVWLPNNVAAVPALRTHGWRPIFESSKSVVMARHVSDERIARATPAERNGRVDFPEP